MINEMNTSGDAAEQMVRMSLNGVEVAAKITGTAAEKLVAMIYTILKDQKKTKGKTRLTNMLKSDRPLKVFSVRDQDLSTFCKEAKKYGILYCVLKDKDSNDGLTDLMVRADDAAKINRIFERFNLATVDMGDVKKEVQMETEQQKEAEAPEKGNAPDRESAKDSPNEQNKSEKEEAFLDELMAPPEKEAQRHENPTNGRTEKDSQSEPILGAGKAEGSASSEERQSVKKQLEEIKKQQRLEYVRSHTMEKEAPVTHKPPKKRRRKKHHNKTLSR